MAYRILYKSSIQRDLRHMSKAEARRVLDRIEKDLAKKPDAYPCLKGEFAGLRRCRVGQYRVLFAILDKDVWILRIAHRKEAHR
ncbi:type II toxin-antitoxin system RelE/ParE family toxin [Candidatus Sumerlaeota bacterium]|nr:type II toxin-antitoxin system RelE/ParE family toxin [Candidatus Sumerlaeota bacterium]